MGEPFSVESHDASKRPMGSLMLNLGLPEDEWNANMLREPFHG